MEIVQVSDERNEVNVSTVGMEMVDIEKEDDEVEVVETVDPVGMSIEDAIAKALVPVDRVAVKNRPVVVANRVFHNIRLKV